MLAKKTKNILTSIQNFFHYNPYKFGQFDKECNVVGW